MSHKITDACQALSKGGFIILTDRRREHEADLMFYGPLGTVEMMNFMIKTTSGVVVIPMTTERLKELELPQMVEDNTERHKTAFTISVDARENTTSGVSASDRAETLKVLCDPKAKPEDLRRPGHLFPLQAHKEGVLGRKGHTEASVDLLKIAGLEPIAVVCELLTECGSIMTEEDAKRFQEKHGFPMLDIEDIFEHVQNHGYTSLLHAGATL